MVTNVERSSQTRQRLIFEARKRFASLGYAGASTESILQAAEVKRGAMYHHFADKAALFEAVCLQICAEAAAALESRSPAPAKSVRAAKSNLIQGSIAWVSFMLQNGVRQIMLLDAPTVLGWQRWQTLERELSTRSLSEGIAEAMQLGAIDSRRDAMLLTVFINGALNALAIHASTTELPLSPTRWQDAIKDLWSLQWQA